MSDPNSNLESGYDAHDQNEPIRNNRNLPSVPRMVPCPAAPVQRVVGLDPEKEVFLEIVAEEYALIQHHFQDYKACISALLQYDIKFRFKHFQVTDAELQLPMLEYWLIILPSSALPTIKHLGWDVVAYERG